MNQTEFRIRCVYVDDETEEEPVDGQTAANQASNVMANLEWAIGDGLLTDPDGQLLVDDHYLSYQVFDTDAKQRYAGPSAQSEPEAHNAVTNICGIETRQEAVVSMAHLDQSTVNSLEWLIPDAILTLPQSNLTISVAFEEYSVIVRHMGDESSPGAQMDYPELDGLAQTLITEYGFHSICFDRDAETIKGFPVFDWQ